MGHSACTFTTPDMNMSLVSTQRSGHTVGAAGALLPVLVLLLLLPSLQGLVDKGQIDQGA